VTRQGLVPAAATHLTVCPWCVGAPAAHRVPSLDPAGHVVLTDTGHDASVSVQAVTAYSGRCPAKGGDGRDGRQAARRVARLAGDRGGIRSRRQSRHRLRM